MQKHIYAILFLLLAQLPMVGISAQIADTTVVTEENQEDAEQSDTTSLLHAFRKGSFEGRFRYFFMSAINEGALTDYYANAFGGGIKYQTAPFHHIQFGLGGFYTFNLGSSNLAKPDSITGSPNRYEIGLFNIANPAQTNNLYKLEYFYLHFQQRHFQATIGKQLLKTPFINPQDGRMRPTFEDGLYLQYTRKKTVWEGGWLYNISPRSTIEWFSVANSIGWYAQGINPNGTAGNYRGNLSSAGIGVFGITQQLNANMHLKIWEQFVENMFNTSMIEWNNIPTQLTSQIKWLGGIRLIAQQTVHNGGNSNPDKAYMQKGNKAYVLSGRMGLKNKHIETTLNYTRITNNGRFLSPREWGIEPFYTFMYRERNEGNGNLNAVMWNVKWNTLSNNLLLEGQIGYYALPDVKNIAMNKYGIPSYGQLNIDIKYQFKKQWAGFDAEFLYTYKKGYGNSYNNPKYTFNKVNLSLFNFIINYSF
jgi:hypothetical protein